LGVNSDIENTIPKFRVWGFWATVGFGVIVTFISLVVQIVITVIFIVAGLGNRRMVDLTELDYAEWLETIDLGLLLSLSIIVSAIICIGVILLIIKVRRGASVADYLGLKSFGIRILIVALAISLAYIGITSLINMALDRSVETDVMTEAYINTGLPVLFWIAIVVFGPVFEEVFFRGFLFEGFRRSKIGVIGAVILTSLVWAGFHLQYGLFEIVSLFFLGVILGIARYKTRSLWVPVSMHAFNNLIAVILMAL
jgi:membrane protease YdiL (CAAX protease family)